MGKSYELNGAKNRWKINSLGARMTSWEALDGDTWRKVCRGNGAVKPSEDNYRAAIMFPWVNRIGGDHWSMEGEPVPVNLSGELTHLHGLVNDVEWQEVSAGAREVTFKTVLERSKWYPRRAKCWIKYMVSAVNGVEALQVEINSEGGEESEIVYVTTGIHPYFLNPFGGVVDPLELYCEAAQEFEVDERLIPTGLSAPKPEHDFRKPHVIGSTKFDTGFVLKEGADPAATLKIKNYEFSIHPIENCGYAQVYIPPHREEIAIEPQSGGADAFRFHQYGLKRLKPAESFRYAVKLAARFS